MKRSSFLKGIFGLAVCSAAGCQLDRKENSKSSPISSVGEEMPPEHKEAAAQLLRQELRGAWARSEEMTLTNVEQMPPEFFTFKYTDEAMTFSEQWRHCVIYTCGQLSAGTGVKNPYKGLIKLPYQMPKERVIRELKTMYAFVRKTIDELSTEKLSTECDFAGETIPVWRLFYALENHIIHHRGQCIVYLRLNGVTPKGYYGW